MLAVASLELLRGAERITAAALLAALLVLCAATCPGLFSALAFPRVCVVRALGTTAHSILNRLAVLVVAPPSEDTTSLVALLCAARYDGASPLAPVAALLAHVPYMLCCAAATVSVEQAVADCVAATPPVDAVLVLARLVFIVFFGFASHSPCLKTGHSVLCIRRARLCSA